MRLRILWVAAAIPAAAFIVGLPAHAQRSAGPAVNELGTSVVDGFTVASVGDLDTNPSIADDLPVIRVAATTSQP